MSSVSPPPLVLEQLDADIAEAERLIAAKLEQLRAALRQGADASEHEMRLRKMHQALGVLYEQRRKLVGAAQSSG